jgi:AraC-like DNA-binding protein
VSEGTVTATTPRTERRFYAEDRAIGRFGMRVFTPRVMEASHWHGHIEANFLSGASMTYLIDDRRVEVPPNQLVLFWANVPHQLISLSPLSGIAPRLANLYLPFDRFLYLPYIAPLQVALLSGGMVALDPALASERQIDGWYRDYRSGSQERREILFMELNAMLRRALLDELTFLHSPVADPQGARATPAAAKAHVVAMVRFIIENLSEPMTNSDVARVTGLHESYAMSLFSRIMRMPVRRFVIRMRLLRARALLFESSATVAAVALQSGFPSPSQFYQHFQRAYGTTPQVLRNGLSEELGWSR